MPRSTARLVRHLVQDAAPAAEVRRRDLTGEAEHAAAAGVCRRQAGAGVEHAWAGDDRAHPDPAGGAGVAVGHVAGGLLVAGVDDADRRLARERVEEAVELHAGQPEDDVDAPPPKALDEQFAAGALRAVSGLRAAVSRST